MIFAKINPVLSMVTQDTLFNPTATFITASHMAAIASPYPLGAENVNFRVTFGNPQFENGSVVSFQTIHQENISLTDVQLENWGTDDSVALEVIATQKGITIDEVVSGSLNNGMF